MFVTSNFLLVKKNSAGTGHNNSNNTRRLGGGKQQRRGSHLITSALFGSGDQSRRATLEATAATAPMTRARRVPSPAQQQSQNPSGLISDISRSLLITSTTSSSSATTTTTLSAGGREEPEDNASCGEQHTARQSAECGGATRAKSPDEQPETPAGDGQQRSVQRCGSASSGDACSSCSSSSSSSPPSSSSSAHLLHSSPSHPDTSGGAGGSHPPTSSHAQKKIIVSFVESNRISDFGLKNQSPRIRYVCPLIFLRIKSFYC